MRHLISPLDFTVEELDQLLETASDIEKNPAKYQDACKGKKIATLFYEPSTRTRLSFEAAMINLGGQVLGFSEASSSSASKGESVADTIRIISCYADICAMRHPKEGAALVAANNSSIPVINAGDGGHQHPTQTLTDLMTIKSLKGRLDNITIGLCGDLKFGRTVHSLINALLRYDNVKFVLISPNELKVPEYIIENIEKAGKAMEICAECIRKLGLDMNLIEAEYTLDCSKIIFVYVADERVDFRELLKELASIFKCRIELRQIGPRNKSKIIGGLGTCGMETCCSRFMNDFDVVSINMAKNQLLALNIQKLSGQCGKLMCCLKFEDSQYKRLREGLPKMNSQIEYKGSRYRITSMNVLLQQVKIENKEDVQFLSFKELWPDIDFSDR